MGRAVEATYREMARRYVAGESAVAIAEDLGYSWRHVYRVLKQLDVKLRHNTGPRMRCMRKAVSV